MEFERGYWGDNKDAPFAILFDMIASYLHPEVDWWDGLITEARRPDSVEDMTRFKQQLREALEHPDRINQFDEHLDHAGQFDDGTNERFLRRIWRDLYPEEPVPGGDEEFRDDLRRTITGELTGRTSTTRYYFTWDTGVDFAAEARQVWQRFYPDEPLPD